MSRKRARFDTHTSLSDEVDSEIAKSSMDSLETPEKVLSFYRLKTHTAAALYDALTDKLYLFQDSEENAVDLAQLIIEQCDPDLLLISTKVEPALLEALKKALNPSARVEARPIKDFSAKQGRNALLDLTVLSGLYGLNDLNDVQMDLDVIRENNLYRIPSYLSVDAAPVLLAAVAALTSYLHKVYAFKQDDTVFKGQIGFYKVNDVQMIKLKDNTMLINQDALKSLQILPRDDRSSTSSSAEALSLLGLLDLCKMTAGKKLLRAWLMRPSMNLTVITDRQNAVELFLKSENQHVVDYVHSDMSKGIKNLHVVMKKIELGTAEHTDWFKLSQFLEYAVSIAEAVFSLHGWQSVNVCHRLLANDFTLLQNLHATLNATIDWKDSKTLQKISIFQGVDEALDHYRGRLAELPKLLDLTANYLAKDLPVGFSKAINVVYYPQLGYLVASEKNETSNLAGSQSEFMNEICPPEWQYQFLTRERIYWKNKEMHDLDKFEGDYVLYIAEAELEIVKALQARVIQFQKQLFDIYDVLTELDVLIAFSKVAKELDWTRPILKMEENVIRMEQAKHPLAELMIDHFIANDCFMSGGFLPTPMKAGISDEVRGDSLDPSKSLLLITGPNGGGKSVFCKTIAVIVVLAQVGSFVPCDNATIGICDAIFTRIATRESASEAASAFLIDCNQISFAIRNCGPRSLLILDEFGKGTESNDGTGLFAGLLEHFASLDKQCPKVILASHFAQIFSLKDNPIPLRYINLAHMSLVSLPAESGTEDITFTFRLKPGILRSSYAAECARLHGIDARVCARAAELAQSFASGRPLREEEPSEEEKRLLKAAELVTRRFLEIDFLIEEDPKATLSKIFKDL